MSTPVVMPAARHVRIIATPVRGLGLALALAMTVGCGADPVGTGSMVPAADAAPVAPDGYVPVDSAPPADVPVAIRTDGGLRTDGGATVLDGPMVTDVVTDGSTSGMDAERPPDGDTLTPDRTPDGGAVAMDAAAPAVLRVGGRARVTANSLNLRTGAGTSNPVVTTMTCGSVVDILGGPSSGWWNVRYMTATGWSSGAYLVPEAAFDPATCMMGTMMSPDAGVVPPGMPGEVASVFTLARASVGYSYYWGHGSWGTDGLNHGTCTGSCPGCSHTGRYGADCSGFVAKVWQVPGPSAVTTDAHPYSTYDFYNASTHWSHLARASVRPADALTYNASGAGHILLFESGTDPWGSIWTYEARGCATGIVHNLRVVGSSYIAIRREGL